MTIIHQSLITAKLYTTRETLDRKTILLLYICISKIEKGDQNLSLEMAYRIAAYFEKLIPEVFPLMEEHLPSLAEMRELPQ